MAGTIWHPHVHALLYLRLNGVRPRWPEQLQLSAGPRLALLLSQWSPA